MNVERAVSVHRDHDRNRQPGHRRILARALVELLAELHDVDLRLTQRGSNRGRRRRLAGNDLELDVSL